MARLREAKPLGAASGTLRRIRWLAKEIVVTSEPSPACAAAAAVKACMKFSTAFPCLLQVSSYRYSGNYYRDVPKLLIRRLFSTIRAN